MMSTLQIDEVIVTALSLVLRITRKFSLFSRTPSSSTKISAQTGCDMEIGWNTSSASETRV